MWFKPFQVTNGQPIGDTCPVQHCGCLLPNNAEEEVQMNLRASKGHVYLTRWPDTQSAVRPLLTADLGMICRVREASVWRAAHFYMAETLLLWQIVSPPISQYHKNAVRASLFSFDGCSWQAAINIFVFLFVLDPVCVSSVPTLKWKVFSLSGEHLKTSDSPVLENLEHLKDKKKGNHKAKV